MNDHERLDKLYLKTLASWKGKRLNAAKNKNKRVLSLSVYQTHRYFNKWFELQDIPDDRKNEYYKFWAG